MDTLGQFGPIIVKPGHQTTGTFTLNKITNLDKSSKHCILDENYSYNQCLRNYVSDNSSCNVDISKKTFKCTNNGLKQLFDKLIELRSSTRKNITQTTGCFPKCVTNKYSFELKEIEKAEWRREWISAFYLSSETTTYEKSIESYSYDEQVFMLQIHFNPNKQDLKIFWIRRLKDLYFCISTFH